MASLSARPSCPWYGAGGAVRRRSSLAVRRRVLLLLRDAGAGRARRRRAPSSPRSSARIDQGPGDGAAAAGVPRAGRRPRSAARQPEADAARREGRRRPAAPHADAGDAVEPDDPRLQAAAPIVTKQLHAEWPISLELEGTYHNLGAVLRSRQQVHAHHQHQQPRRSTQKDPPTPNATIDDHVHGDDVRAARADRPAPPKPGTARRRGQGAAGEDA